ncbi:hypothetical protein BHE74_00042311 [Ensete ventricosum]|nr:hypothetical protein BHE74_00042311 [Ensete ventricosum]
MKKWDGHKLCTKSHAELSYGWFFYAPSRKFKILVIPDVLFFLVSKDNIFCKRFVQRSFVYTSHRLKPEVS